MKLQRTGALIFAAALAGMGAAGGICGKAETSKESQLYDFDKIISPIWEGSVCTQESVLPMQDESGAMQPISLLYEIDEILEIKNGELTISYEKEKDYRVENGKLIIPQGSEIPTMTYDEMHPKTGTEGFENINGGFINWQEGSYYHTRQIAVTYSHKNSYEGYVPEAQGNLLLGSYAKLNGKDDFDFNLLFYGDSITEGGNTSGREMIEVSPYLPIYPELFTLALQKKYNKNNIHMYNEAVGGKDSVWGLKNIKESILDKYTDLDLVVLAFGMNDTWHTAKQVADQERQIISTLQENYPGIEIIVVTTTLPNPEAKYYSKSQPEQRKELIKLRGEGVAVADITALHSSILAKKNFYDVTGSGVNHINDYITRVYVQTLLKTLEKENSPAPSSQDKNGCKSIVFPLAGTSMAGGAILFASRCGKKKSATHKKNK